ncbi:uncharacterized protein LOC131622648 isoform X2 [Vicia villosa]|uniref:uncharacterized protein LOC131622648 isoform X2 n=1 Tax=Vicia villosa TaxID=3911 RepID=UPI00273C028F|nr:uncharacterized protein LOC131622648 isoform X2 [Vicia villosa]
MKFCNTEMGCNLQVYCVPFTEGIQSVFVLPECWSCRTLKNGASMDCVCCEYMICHISKLEATHMCLSLLSLLRRSRRSGRWGIKNLFGSIVRSKRLWLRRWRMRLRNKRREHKGNAETSHILL